MTEKVSSELSFARLLGLRALIKESVILDQGIGNYIGYDYATETFEVTIFAQSQSQMAPYWVAKFDVKIDNLVRFLNAVRTMIERLERTIPQEARTHAGKSEPIIRVTGN